MLLTGTPPYSRIIAEIMSRDMEGAIFSHEIHEQCGLLADERGEK
jgi:hypothetical protein